MLYLGTVAEEADGSSSYLSNTSDKMRANELMGGLCFFAQPNRFPVIRPNDCYDCRQMETNKAIHPLPLVGKTIVQPFNSIDYLGICTLEAHSVAGEVGKIKSASVTRDSSV